MSEQSHVESQASFDLLEAVARYLTQRGYHVTNAGPITVEKENGERRLVIQFNGGSTQ